MALILFLNLYTTTLYYLLQHILKAIYYLYVPLFTMLYSLVRPSISKIIIYEDFNLPYLNWSASSVTLSEPNNSHYLSFLHQLGLH